MISCLACCNDELVDVLYSRRSYHEAVFYYNLITKDFTWRFNDCGEYIYNFEEFIGNLSYMSRDEAYAIFLNRAYSFLNTLANPYYAPIGYSYYPHYRIPELEFCYIEYVDKSISENSIFEFLLLEFTQKRSYYRSVCCA